MSASYNPKLVSLTNVNQVLNEMQEVVSTWTRLETKEQYEEAFTSLAANFCHLNECMLAGKVPDAWKENL